MLKRLAVCLTSRIITSIISPTVNLYSTNFVGTGLPDAYTASCTDEFVHASSSGLTTQITSFHNDSLTNVPNVSYISPSKLGKYCYKLRSKVTTLDKSLYHMVILLLACSVELRARILGVKTYMFFQQKHSRVHSNNRGMTHMHKRPGRGQK